VGAFHKDDSDRPQPLFLRIRYQTVLEDARNEILEVFADASGERVVSRWLCTGRNRGIFGLPADGRPVSFTGIAIWRVRDGRLGECWAERAALEAFRALSDGVSAP
jgi:predicted ester cyclase